MYEHRDTFNVLFQVTTAAAVLAAAAHPYQISLFVLLSLFQNHPKVTIVLEIHINKIYVCPYIDIQPLTMYRPAKDNCK